MTQPLDLDAIRKRADKANAPTEFPGRDEDADFIAHARQDIPALISEVEALRQDTRKDALLEIRKSQGLELTSLRAKLEKAKEALQRIAVLETNITHSIMAKRVAKESLAELEDKKEP